MSKPIASIRPISTLEDFPHRLWLVDALTDAPLTSGAVSIAFCTKDTATPFSNEAICTLTHIADGEWRGTHQSDDLGIALPAIGTVFDRVLRVYGVTAGTFLDQWQRVAVAPIQAPR